MFVSSHRLRVAVPTAAVLLLAGVPFLHAQFAAISERDLPAGDQARQVAQIAGAQFGAAGTAPAVVLVHAPLDTPAMASVLARAAVVPGVRGVTAPQAIGPNASRFSAMMPADNVGRAAQRAVKGLRALGTPALPVSVGGFTADFIDARHSIAQLLPLALAIVALTSGLALFLLTGSLVLPIKALLMNALTLSAVLGALVFIFQDGRLQGLLGYQGVGNLDLTMPVLLFAIAFGLSTDYGVFLLARIKEEHDRGLSNAEAVAAGLERTGRIVTAAALLFCVAFGSFVTCRLIFMKEAGVGVALSVLIDALLIRALLVPSLMALLGDWNWWAPRPLRALWRRIAISEGDPAPAALT
jgi:RND superfamily putative drug exporter